MRSGALQEARPLEPVGRDKASRAFRRLCTRLERLAEPEDKGRKTGNRRRRGERGRNTYYELEAGLAGHPGVYWQLELF